VAGICAAALAFFMDVSQLAGMVRKHQTLSFAYFDSLLHTNINCRTL
jgi:hypothetical protein